MPNVFYSWQSDAPARETRNLIRDALEAAVSALNADIDFAERPESALIIDHDTKGMSGSPDIVSSILKKIESAAAFVADVTPIAIVNTGNRERHVQNPNVLIELGYAKKALGLERIVQVWNTAVTGCSVDDLPFDMRGRRGPISFHLPVGASKDDLRAARMKLTKSLSDALAAIDNIEPSEPIWPAWRVPNSRNPAIWFEEGEHLVVNETGHASGKKIFPTAPTQYVRILPRHWTRPSEDRHAALLGHISGLSWGRTAGGFLTYDGSVRNPEIANFPNGTMQFFDTGEVWAIDRSIVYEWRGKLMIHGDEMFGRTISFLSRQLRLMAGSGAKFPMKVRLGVSGLLESHWPLARSLSAEPQAVEDAVEIEGSLDSGTHPDLEALLITFWTKVRDAYGLSAPDEGRITKAMSFINSA